jgi:hypothetical protein
MKFGIAAKVSYLVGLVLLPPFVSLVVLPWWETRDDRAVTIECRDANGRLLSDVRVSFASTVLEESESSHSISADMEVDVDATGRLRIALPRDYVDRAVVELQFASRSHGLAWYWMRPHSFRNEIRIDFAPPGSLDVVLERPVDAAGHQVAILREFDDKPIARADLSPDGNVRFPALQPAWYWVRLETRPGADSKNRRSRGVERTLVEILPGENSVRFEGRP